MNNHLQTEIKIRNAERKKCKRKWDKMLNFVNDYIENTSKKICFSEENITDNKARLLTEGMVVFSDGSPRDYIMKGTLEKFLNGDNVHIGNISEDFIGAINIRHIQELKNLFPIGSWNKEDLSIIDLENGRKALEVNLSSIDEESIFIKEIKRLGVNMGLSAEFYAHYNEEKTEEMGFPVIDEILITDFAIVDECGDVECSGLKLNSEDQETETEELENEEPLQEEEIQEEEIQEEQTETEEEIQENEEETTEENTVNEELVVVEETESQLLKEIFQKMEKLEQEIEELKTTNSNLTEENEKLKIKEQIINEKLKNIAPAGEVEEEKKEYIFNFTKNSNKFF